MHPDPSPLAGRARKAEGVLLAPFRSARPRAAEFADQGTGSARPPADLGPPSPILVYATSLISISMILAAGLSFLGLGATPPNPEWGLMLNNLRPAIWVAPMTAALPGVMIFLTSMSFNLMSDGLRQAMDVRL